MMDCAEFLFPRISFRADLLLLPSRHHPMQHGASNSDVVTEADHKLCAQFREEIVHAVGSLEEVDA